MLGYGLVSLAYCLIVERTKCALHVPMAVVATATAVALRQAVFAFSLGVDFVAVTTEVVNLAGRGEVDGPFRLC